MSAYAVFAITTRGLEPISLEEIAAIRGVTEATAAYRRITARCTGSLKDLLNLKTVDDVFLQLAEWSDIQHERSTLAVLRTLSAELNLKAHFPALLTLRPIPRIPTFSVTASFVGQRNYTMPEIKTAVAEGIARRYPQWHYSDDDDAANLNVRVFIEHDQAVVGLRIGEKPLHRRAYKQDHLPGSLKPTVAAAMLRLAAIKPRMHMVDVCCGSGTIVAEAQAVGALAYGGDISPEAVHSARNNVTHAARVMQWDMRKLPLAGASVDCIVSNLPWGRQITVNDDLRTLYADAFSEMQRVVKPGGVLALLTSVPDLLPSTPHHMIEISLFGQTPVIALYRT